MSWSVATIRDGLKTALQTIPGLRAYDTVPGQVAVPAAVVTSGEPLVTYDLAMGDNADALNFVVLVLVQYATERPAQDGLDGYLNNTGPSSVKAAIEGNLGGAAVDANVTTATGYGVYTYNNVDYLGVKFNVEVMV